MRLLWSAADVVSSWPSPPTLPSILALLVLVSLPYDASGGFRVYQMSKISPDLIDSIECRNYEFFFESLTRMHRRGLSIAEVPIDLPARTYGHSKMKLKHVVSGFTRLIQLAWRLRFSAAKIQESWNGKTDFPKL